VTSRVLYRVAAVLILLFDLGHSAGFPWSDPKWGVDISAMKTTRFPILGFSRTYWDFYVGFGLTISVFLLLAAVLAWQLGALATQTPPLMRLTAWTLVVCFAVMTILNWMYFFTLPIAFSGLITLCLAGATWLSARAA